MSDGQLHRIDDCLSEDWIDAWTAGVVRDVEAFLEKYAAFDAFLEEND